MSRGTTRLIRAHPRPGDLVRVEYQCTVDPGRLVASTAHSRTIRLGDDELPPGLDEIIETMQRGERRFVTLPPRKAFGEVDFDQLHTLPRAELPHGDQLQPDQRVWVSDRRGKPRLATVMKLSEQHALVHFQHPLAGKRLHCSLHLIDFESERS